MLRMNRFFFNIIAAMVYFIILTILTSVTCAFIWIGYNLAIEFI